MNIGKVAIFVDGENISTRYKEMIKSGRRPKPDNIVIDECFVWNQAVLNSHLWNVHRVNYYTSAVGSEDRILEIREAISRVKYSCRAKQIFLPSGVDVFQTMSGQIVPHVRKKSSRAKKESVCDISISVDAMRACYRDHVDKIWIFSGDGDFLSLYKEVMHSGKHALVSAFSSGLNSQVPLEVDEFFDLDRHFFEN